MLSVASSSDGSVTVRLSLTRVRQRSRGPPSRRSPPGRGGERRPGSIYGAADVAIFTLARLEERIAGAFADRLHFRDDVGVLPQVDRITFDLIHHATCSCSHCAPRSSEDSEMSIHAACLLLRQEVLDALGSCRSVTPSSVAAASLICINVGSKNEPIVAQSQLRSRCRLCGPLFCLCASAKGSEHARELWRGSYRCSSRPR